MFNLNSICKSFGNLMALNKLDLQVAENSITCLSGMVQEQTNISETIRNIQ